MSPRSLFNKLFQILPRFAHEIYVCFIRLRHVEIIIEHNANTGEVINEVTNRSKRHTLPCLIFVGVLGFTSVLPLLDDGLDFVFDVSVLHNHPPKQRDPSHRLVTVA